MRFIETHPRRLLPAGSISIHLRHRRIEGTGEVTRFRNACADAPARGPMDWR
jgi:hypothetical protein